MKNKHLLREKSLAATLAMILVIAVLFVMAYLKITSALEERSLGRMEEGVNTVIEEIKQKLEQDSHILNATADIIESAEDMRMETLQRILSSVSPLLETMSINVLLPDNRAISASGAITDFTGIISYEEEAQYGEHVSDRMTSAIDGNILVLRHFVPIVRNGETAALLFGTTRLSALPEVMNIDNIYNAQASVYIIDTETGDYLMDTWHEELGNIRDFRAREVRTGTDWDADIASLLNLETGYMVYKSESTGEWLYFYYAPAGINQWSIAVSVPEKAAFVNLYEIQQVCLATALIMAITIAIYYLWVHKNAREITSRAVEHAVLEEKLHKAEAAERAKTTFLSNMSHDIRTPMNAIIGFATLAETNIDNQERVMEYLRKILSSGNHLLSLINDILDMSRIESGKLNIDEKPCSISEIFQDMRNIIQAQMSAKQLRFFMDTVDVTDENIYCDKLHVNQVLLNLLSNAIKFTPTGGSVTLTVRQEHPAPEGCGAYEIRVKDTGIGMSPEFAERIFEPFERERNSTVSGIQGTGLGMAITKSIVDAMGGTIALETEQGTGSEFILNFTFRLQSREAEAVPIQELLGQKILVVDDSFPTCDSVTKMLLQLGLRAEWSMYGQEAALRAKQAAERDDEFYAYIVDWVLPDTPGVEVVRALRAFAGPDKPIIVLTAYDWTDFEEAARAAGATAFCAKPIFLSELRDIFMTIIGNAREPEPVLPVAEERVTGARLLLVEDNKLNREIAEEILTECGFIVYSVTDGTEAVETVKNAAPGDFDLILMDIQMPIMNGYAAARAIRALPDPALSRIPIVAMTANAFDEDRQKAYDAGMNAHVAKPIDVTTLMKVLSELLGKNSQS